LMISKTWKAKLNRPQRSGEWALIHVWRRLP